MRGSQEADGPVDARTAPPSALRFPAVARLGLDELLDQLIERAGEVKATQGRLRGLLAATRHISAGLELSDLLQRIVESARALVGARYAALGVVREGRLVRFVHTGMSAEQVAAIGHLPEGKGVLGTLIEQAQPLRLADLSTHPDAVGLPPEHPPIRSFLGVPIKVGGTVYGNLYLGEAPAAEGFGHDDEELVTALASSAGIAIENAQLLDAARRRERWRAASAELVSSLLVTETGPDEALTRLLELASEVAAAHGAALTRMDSADPGVAHVTAAVGGLAAWAHRAPGTQDSVTRAALEHGGALVITDAAQDPRTVGVSESAPEVRAIIAVPLTDGPPEAGEATRSVLLLTRGEGAEPFGATETQMLEEFAARATAAIALAQARHHREAVQRMEDREALVLELNQEVIRRVQRVGLALSSTASTADDAVRTRLLAQVDELDEIVRAVRDTVFPR